MLVVLLDDQVILPTSVCTSCLMASQSGQPRWRDGELCCGQRLGLESAKSPAQYRCQMGFRLAQIDSSGPCEA